MPKFLKVILNIIFIPILFSSITALLLTYGLSSSFSSKNIKNTVKATIKANITEDENKDTILKELYEQAESYGIKRKVVNKALLSDNMQTLISEYIYYTTINTKKELSKEHVDTLIDNTIDDINKDFLLPPLLKEELKVDLYNKYKEQRTNTINLKDSSGNVNALTIFTKIMNIITNIKFRLLLFSSLFITIIIIVLVNLKKFIFLRKISITSLGAATSIFIISKLMVLIAQTKKSILTIIKSILTPLTNYSLILIIISIIMLIGYIILNNITKRKGLEN